MKGKKRGMEQERESKIDGFDVHRGGKLEGRSCSELAVTEPRLCSDHPVSLSKHVHAIYNVLGA